MGTSACCIYNQCIFKCCWFYLLGLKYEFNFAIMVAGFKSLCHPHLNYYFKESSIPSLHVYGENDKVISRGKSHHLNCKGRDMLIIIRLVWSCH